MVIDLVHHFFKTCLLLLRLVEEIKGHCYRFQSIQLIRQLQQSHISKSAQMKTTLQLAESLILQLSSDRFDLTIANGSSCIFKIRSDQKVSYFCALPELRREYMEKNTTVAYHFVMIVDTTLTWSIFCIKSLQTEKPIEMYKGKFLSQKSQLKSIFGVYEEDGKLLVIFDKLNILYLCLPRQLAPGEYLINRQFIPYGEEPAYQHQDFSALKGFLPQEEEYDLTATHYSILSKDTGILFIAMESKSSKLSSVYTLELNRKNSYILSGKNVVVNINGKVKAIYPSNTHDTFLVQTSNALYVWNIQTEEKQGTFEPYAIVFPSFLTKVQKKQGIQYVGVTENNKILSITIDPKSRQLKTGQFFPNTVQGHQLLQFYPSLKSSQNYFLTKKEQVFVLRQNMAEKIIGNEHTKIIRSRLCLSPCFNFLIVDKKRGALSEKVLFGNHFFVYDSIHYAHGMMLNSSLCIDSGTEAEVCWSYLTSPLMGLIKLNLTRKEKVKSITKNKAKQAKSKEIDSHKPLYELTLEKNVNLANEQTLFLNQKYQVTSEQLLTIGKSTVKISKLFQQATEYISTATVLANQLIVLGIEQQIHVFDAKLSRKYIYCFNSQVKNIYALNNVNVIGVQLYEDSSGSKNNQLHILVLGQQKAMKLKNVVVSEGYKHFQLQSTINTTQYKLNIFGSRLLICSNDALHKYQVQKIVVEEFTLPLPQTNLQTMQILPLSSFSKENNETDFIVIYRQEELDLQKKFDQVQVYLGCISPKYLFKKMDLNQIHITYERILTLTEMPRDRSLLAMRYTSQEATAKGSHVLGNLIVIGEKYFSIWAIKHGKIEIQWLQDSRYLQSQLQKIESVPKEIMLASKQLEVLPPISLIPTSKNQYYLLHNQTEIYYACYQLSKMTTISYYSLINDQFNTFRNNLNLTQLNDQEFMSNFAQKMRIKDIKYLTDGIILVLYEYCIVVLQIGLNNCLVVKQQLKFGSNEMNEVIKIQQFLQNYDQQSIYLRQSHGRIYLLKKQDKSYQIQFDSYMDEDVLLFSRLSNWYKKDRVYYLNSKSLQKEYEVLVLKKDGQLIVKSANEAHEDMNRLVYI